MASLKLVSKKCFFEFSETGWHRVKSYRGVLILLQFFNTVSQYYWALTLTLCFRKSIRSDLLLSKKNESSSLSGRRWSSYIVLFSLPAGQVTTSSEKNAHETLGHTRLISNPYAFFCIPYFLCNIHWLVIYWLTLIL